MIDSSRVLVLQPPPPKKKSFSFSAGWLPCKRISSPPFPKLPPLQGSQVETLKEEGALSKERLEGPPSSQGTPPLTSLCGWGKEGGRDLGQLGVAICPPPKKSCNSMLRTYSISFQTTYSRVTLHQSSDPSPGPVYQWRS